MQWGPIIPICVCRLFVLVLCCMNYVALDKWRQGHDKRTNRIRKSKHWDDLKMKEVILTQCFICNGEEEGGADCRRASCPLYRFKRYNPLRKKFKAGRKVSEELRKRFLEMVQRWRATEYDRGPGKSSRVTQTPS